MRRIFKTTTALVACLSIITPQLALAQDQQAPDGQQQILPKQKKKQAEEGQAQQPEQQQQEAQQQKQQPQQKPRAERQEPPQEQKPAQAEEQQEPRRQVQPRQEQPEPERPAAGQDAPQPRQQQAAEPAPAPQDKPAVTQAQDPVPKPPVVEAETPRAKPADADQAADRAEQLREDAQKQPGAKPDSAKSVTTADPAPDPKPDEPRRDQPSVQAQQPPAEPEDMPDAEALKERLEARDQDQPAPGQPQPGEAAQKPEPRRQQVGGEQQRSQDDQQQAGDDQQRQKQAGDQQRQDDPQQAGQDTTAAPGAAELARRLQEQQQDSQPRGQQQGQQQGQPGQPQPGEVQAPEARVTPNEVAKRAAENPPPVAATALAAGAQEQQQQGQVDEVQITEQNARRSDQDFENAIIQGLNGDQQREEQRREARSDDDDDDDNLKDIGKLLLAGAAGFAVGKMLSNDRQVALNTGDRVVVTLPDGSQQVIKDDNALLYQPGSNVRTETFDDGSTRTTVLREDGSRVVTIRDANMNILRRTLVRADGSETRLIDDTAAEPVRISTLPAPPPVEVSRGPLDEAALREALRREASVDRRFTLGQIRDIPEVRALVAPVNVPEITFETGSSAITPDQAQQLATLGKVIRDSVDQNPAEIYMIEGYTDAVGSDAANLALSDRRAESVALALTEYFQVPPENMVVQGYGEQFLLVPSDGPERDNRRVAVRRITDLMEQN